MKARIALVAIACVGAGVAQAQISPIPTQLSPFTFELGYYHSNSFSGTHLSGVELGVSQSILNLPVVGELRVGASLVFSKFLGSGADGNLYRLRALYKTPGAGPQGAYGLAGINFQSAQANGGSFQSQSGFGVEFGVGIPLTHGLPGMPTPAIEVGYRLGPKDVLRGFSAGVTVKF